MAEDRDPDLDIAIGEDAFKAGFMAGLEVAGGMPALRRYADDWSAHWDVYTPPEGLCGGGQKHG